MELSIIGLGNMGQAILKGILNNEIIKSENITAADKKFISAESADKISMQDGYQDLNFTADNREAVKNSNYIILAVKPQVIDFVLDEIKDFTADKNIISIAAGISRKHIENYLGKKTKITRIMPNTPALVSEGMSALSFSANIEEKEKVFIMEIFNSFGKTVEVKEEDMDAVTAVSGSGPAFVYLFIEALSDAGVLKGLDRSTALKLAAQTVKGAAEMVLETDKHPGELKDMVTSPAGTTIAGTSSLENDGFRAAVINAASAAADRSEELGE